MHKTTLQLLKNKKNYDKLRGVVNTQLIDYDIRRALNTLDTYWRNYPAHEEVHPDVFLTELGLQHEDLTADQMRMYQGMVQVMMQNPDSASAEGLIRSLRTLDFAAELERKHELYQEGADIDLHQEIKDLVDTYEQDIARSIDLDYCRDTLADLIEDTVNGTKLRWHLACLNGAMPDVRTGHQVIFAARPGKGKTSFCAAQAVSVAADLEMDRPILWFNNEGKGRAIKGTLYRAALKSTFNDIINLGAAEAQARYDNIIGGQDRIRIFDIHGRDYKYLERIIDKHNPIMVIFDMLDNVHGFADAARTDLRLEQIYQWARERSVLDDFFSLPTSQISVEGEGLAWCDQSMLKDSKTAKQGACEAIVMMGAKSAPEFLNSRFMYIPKVAKQDPLPGFRPDCAREVLFDGSRCTFTEPQGGTVNA